MRREVRIPKWGLTVETITIREWHSQVGDIVTQGEPLCDVDTDKASSVIEAPVSGTLVEIIAAVDKECEVAEVIAVIETEGA